MKQVNSRVVLNHAIIAQLERAAIIALEQTGDYVQKEVTDAQVIPFDSGTLQNESTYVNKDESEQGSVKLVSSTPYARRLYFHPEYNFRTEKNPNARGKWLEDWTEEGKYAKKVKKFYAIAFRKLGGLKWWN